MAHIDDYWAWFFGLSVASFMKPQLQVVPHAQLQGYEGAWLFRRGQSTLISVPPEWVGRTERQVQHQPQGVLTDHDVAAIFGDRVDRVIGPAYQGFLEKADFRPVLSSARPLFSEDDVALRKLANECNAEEWEHSDIEVGRHPLFGCFAEGQLVAVSTYSIGLQNTAMPGLITHPNYRGRGYGKAVLSAAVQTGLSEGLLMLYQTLLHNRPAVAAGESLGYKQYATHLAVRLR